MISVRNVPSWRQVIRGVEKLALFPRKDQKSSIDLVSLGMCGAFSAATRVLRVASLSFGSGLTRGVERRRSLNDILRLTRTNVTIGMIREPKHKDANG